MSFDDLYDRLIRGEEKLALVGLGYVGMPIAVEFAKHVKVIGFNHNERRIQQYKSGIDPTNEVGNEVISKTTVRRSPATPAMEMGRRSWYPSQRMWRNWPGDAAPASSGLAIVMTP